MPARTACCRASRSRRSRRLIPGRMACCHAIGGLYSHRQLTPGRMACRARRSLRAFGPAMRWARGDLVIFDARRRSRVPAGHLARSRAACCRAACSRALRGRPTFGLPICCESRAGLAIGVRRHRAAGRLSLTL
jgi:hypothetical protein